MQDSAQTTDQMKTGAKPDQDAAASGEAEHARAGRHAVRTLFWDRLDEAGVGRTKGLTLDQYADLRDRMVERLSYMAAPNLVTLAQLIIDAAQGPWRNKCPEEVVIWNQAKALQQPPLKEHPIWTSWVRSVEGPPALAGGYLVELADFVAKAFRAPGAYELTRIQEAAASNARRLHNARFITPGDAARADELAWAGWYTRRLEALTSVVQEGMAHRLAQTAAQRDHASEVAQ